MSTVGAQVVQGVRRAHSPASQSYLTAAIIVFVAYFVAGKLGQATTHIRSSNLGPVWPAFGVAIASVVLFGTRIWPVLAGAILVVASSSGVPFVTAAGQSAGSLFAALIGGGLLRQVGFDRSLSRLRDALYLMLFGAVVAAVVSASTGMWVLYATGQQAYDGIASAWFIYWFGDSTGVLLITPLALTASTLPRSGIASRPAEFAALILSLAFACFVIFGDLPVFPVKLHVLAFAVLPFIVWAAIRFSVLGVTLAALCVATIATIETAMRSGPFWQGTPMISAVLLDVFFAVLSVSGVMLAAVIAEREHVESERARLAREKATLEAVRESEDKLRLILESTAEAIYGLDAEWRCTFCNPACVRALGYTSADQLLGKNMHALIHHTRADGSAYLATECPTYGVIRTQKGVHVDDDLLWRADGTSFHVECWSYPQMKGDQVVGAVVAFIDITQRKQAEAQVATLREELVHLGRVAMLDALAASLAHEINQPLTAVTANTEAALRLMTTTTGPQFNELRETLTDIRSDNLRAGEVVQRMRTLLKKDTSRHEAFHVNGAVADVVKLIKNRAVGRHIVVDLDLDGGLTTIVGDRIQFQQVLLNLLINACDAVQDTELPMRRVSLRTSRHDGMAIVEVRDQGPGLQDDELTRVFEPFYTTKRDGLGLGLSICRAIVQSHGGALEAVRNHDRGMTFSATFPLFLSATRPTVVRNAGVRLES